MREEQGRTSKKCWGRERKMEEPEERKDEDRE
jgi:hypothetical protein